MARWLESLQAQLLFRLGLVFLVTTAACGAVLIHEARHAAQSVNERELARRADQLASAVVSDPDGTSHLVLPPDLERLFGGFAATDLYAVLLPHGTPLASSAPAFAALAARWSGTAGKHVFTLETPDAGHRHYFGITSIIDGASGPLSVSVAHATAADRLADEVVAEFVTDVAWVFPLFAVLTLATSVWSVRRGLRPVLRASSQAAAINPDAADVRIAVLGFPRELRPLVDGVNRALDRLERGFAAQRQFTAHAAHELRTPLAILTAGLDALEDSAAVERLRADAARMNRLVEQLLRVARLESAPLDLSTRIDLGALAAGVVGYLATWAIARGRTIGLEAPEQPVWVVGNGDAIEDALRNLIENAVRHAPEDSEVTVMIAEDGSIVVVDDGPGVADDDKKHVFERFWRGRGERGTGAGLGLAIVAEIARLHGGRVEVARAEGRGAAFRLRLRPA